jgi:hypothetical protein
MTYDEFLAEPGMRVRVERLLAFIMAEGGADASGKPAQFDAGDAMDSALWVVALLMERGPMLKTPRDIRIASEDLGKQLHLMMKVMRERTLANGKHPLDEYGEATILANDV